MLTLLLVVVIPLLTDAHTDLLRQVNFILCGAAFGGLVWRLLGRWTLSFPLARVLVGLFAALELIVALASARRAQLGGPLNELAWAVTIHAVITIGVVIVWPRLMVGVGVEHRGHVRTWGKKP